MTPAGTRNRSRSAKRQRRSKAEIGELCDTIYRIVAADRPMTVRQVFYRLVSEGLIEKTEREYKNTVVRLLTKLRVDGVIPFGWIADSTRWQRKPRSYSGLDHLLRDTRRLYQRSIWDQQDEYVEVWLEKEALSGVLYDVTAEFDVPLMVTRGYASLSYLHAAAQTIESIGKPTHLLYFGDHDPSGIDIARKVHADIQRYAPSIDVRFTRIAVTPDQIHDWNLPTRPTKATDSRSKSFQGESVEVDSIAPNHLRQLARDAIEQHIDERALQAVLVAEECEREWLDTQAEQRALNGVDDDDTE